jgi:hypothetical protein
MAAAERPQRSNVCAGVRLTTRHASLEDVFVTLTGRHLREDEEK